MNNFTKKQKIILITVIIVVMGIIGYYVYGKDRNYEEFTEDEIMVKENKTNVEDRGNLDKIVVHITGAVQNEGIVELEENNRIADAIDAAGGLREDADMSKINLAYILEDGIKVNIPSKNDKNQEEREELTTESEDIVENDEVSNIRK